MGVVGCILGFLVVIYLCYKDWSVYIASIVGAAVVIAFNVLPFMDTLLGSYVNGMFVPIKSFFFLLLFGSIQSKIYSESGAAFSIADTIMSKLLRPGASNTKKNVIAVAAICGFAGVVTNTEAFTTMLNAITGINMSPMLICAVVVSIMCMLTGGSSTGQLISLPLIAPKLLDLGLNVNAIHRIACFAATTLDSMPYSGAILMLLPMCRMKLREIYPPMFITTVIATTCGTIAVIVMCALFPGLC